ncbi:hypothetical protein I8752_02685 [Nostocaceae cyanobacterium CENA369]|uniref:Uncharacterized protein n=1 Tax=Dendronalium phyllosphericum CENA369 TaxID=1725256 RepID=A0A8J7I258_9NOST|nr:hypothetical protein [Dendronalium phyllosphericum]MBH8571955.1 hypothetical protein [Dendronalium phyllosphericum CENA369]
MLFCKINVFNLVIAVVTPFRTIAIAQSLTATRFLLSNATCVTVGEPAQRSGSTLREAAEASTALSTLLYL